MTFAMFCGSKKSGDCTASRTNIRTGRPSGISPGSCSSKTARSGVAHAGGPFAQRRGGRQGVSHDQFLASIRCGQFRDNVALARDENSIIKSKMFGQLARGDQHSAALVHKVAQQRMEPGLVAPTSTPRVSSSITSVSTLKPASARSSPSVGCLLTARRRSGARRAPACSSIASATQCVDGRPGRVKTSKRRAGYPARCSARSKARDRDPRSFGPRG